MDESLRKRTLLEWLESFTLVRILFFLCVLLLTITVPGPRFLNLYCQAAAILGLILEFLRLALRLRNWRISIRAKASFSITREDDD